MNLPDWATHVAVDSSGLVCAFEGEPEFYDYGGTNCGAWHPVGERYVTLFASDAEYCYPASLSRLLCVEIPRVPVKSEEST